MLRTPHRRHLAPLATFLAGLFLLLLAAPGSARIKWKEVDKALLAETRGIVDPEAPAETVLWEIHVTDEMDGKGLRSEIQHYRRVKIFNDRGRDLEAQVEIPYLQGERVDDVIGRTIRPNGMVVELKKDAVFDRVTVKAAGLKGKAKSFAMPAVEAGAVIEYQWRSVRRDELTEGMVFPAQRTTPIRSMIMVFSPFTHPDFPYEMRVRAFNTVYDPPEKTDRSLTIRLKNIRGVLDEPYMPPVEQVRPWFYVDYTDGKEPPLDSFWKKVGQNTYEVWKPYLGASPSVRRIADSLTAGRTDPVERIASIHEFCRTRIRNVYDDAHDFTDDFRATLLEDRKRTPAETLQRGYGTGADVNALFASLAEAAGFRSRIAVTADRSEIFFLKGNRMPSQLSEHVVAVQVNGEWKFYDPAIRNTPTGMLPWWEESQDALILDPEAPVFVSTQLSLPSRSMARRIGRLRLAEDGTLEGAVTEIYTGHLASRNKEALDHLSAEGRMEEIEKQLRARWASASVESLVLGGVDDPLQPYAIGYRISIPGYADRAGKRILLQPDLFEREGAPVFTASTRTHWLYFQHPWSEEDSLTIELPPGIAVEADPAPDPLSVGRTIAHRMAVEVDQNVLRFHRYLAFGMDGTILIDPSEYARVKKTFDAIHQRDGYLVTLRPAADSAER